MSRLTDYNNPDPYRRKAHLDKWESHWGDDPAFIAAQEAGELYGEEGFKRVMKQFGLEVEDATPVSGDAEQATGDI